MSVAWIGKEHVLFYVEACEYDAYINMKTHFYPMMLHHIALVFHGIKQMFILQTLLQLDHWPHGS